MHTVLIPGKPRPQGSLKFMTNPRTGQGFGKYPQHTMDHRNFVIAQLISWWADKPPLSGPVAVKCVFTFARPKSHYGTGRNAEVIKDSAPDPWMSGAPDTDKLLRLVNDALTYAGVIGDDSQVAVLRGEKVWGTSGCTEVSIVSL